MTPYKTQIRTAIFALALGLSASSLMAQTPAPATITADENRELNLHAYVELMRSDIRTQKVAVIAQVMGFTDAEDAVFWPIYRDYEAKLARINDDRLKLTTDYASVYQNLTDADADRLITTALDLQTRRTALTAEYYQKLKAAMPAKTAARVVQVEHQLLLLLDLQIAASLPIAQ